MIDQAPPALNITSPLTGDIMTGAFTLRGEASDANDIASVEVLLNGEHFAWTDTRAPETRIDSANACTAPYNSDGSVGSGIATCYSNGPVTITLRAIDISGKATERSVGVVFDNAGPNISVAKASGGWFWVNNFARKVTCSYSVALNDESSASWTVSVYDNLTLENSSENAFTVTAFGSGNRRIAVTATDVLGHSSVKNIWINVNYNSPDLCEY